MPANGQRRSRRQWGWHPLQPEWAQRIVDAADPGDQIVVDVGAGTGALTEPLVRAGLRVVAVELNHGRVDRLRQRFTDDNVTVVRSDITRLRWPGKPFHVIASPPYNVTTQLVRTLLSIRHLHAADLVLQRSAANRLAADPPGRHVSAYTLECGLAVPRKAFHPPPKVDSVVLRIRRRGGRRR